MYDFPFRRLPVEFKVLHNAFETQLEGGHDQNVEDAGGILKDKLASSPKNHELLVPNQFLNDRLQGLDAYIRALPLSTSLTG